MGNIIASQLNLDGGQAFTGAIVLCALLSTCATYAFIKNGFKKGFHHDDIIMNICTIVFTIMLIIGAYTSINHSQIQQNEYNVVKQATSKELRFTTPDDSTEIRIYNSRIKILVERGYPYEKALLATIELDSKAGTYTLTNVDSQRYENIGKIIDDLNYLFYQGFD